jgi:hypothetical protein
MLCILVVRSSSIPFNFQRSVSDGMAAITGYTDLAAGKAPARPVRLGIRL